MQDEFLPCKCVCFLFGSGSSPVSFSSSSSSLLLFSPMIMVRNRLACTTTRQHTHPPFRSFSCLPPPPSPSFSGYSRNNAPGYKPSHELSEEESAKGSAPCYVFSQYFFRTGSHRSTPRTRWTFWFVFVHLSAMLWFHSPPLCDDSLFRCDFGSVFWQIWREPWCFPFSDSLWDHFGFLSPLFPFRRFGCD